MPWNQKGSEIQRRCSSSNDNMIFPTRKTFLFYREETHNTDLSKNPISKMRSDFFI